MSIERSFHSDVGICARRRSSSASLVETICNTMAWPSSRSRAIAAISVGQRRARGGLGIAVVGIAVGAGNVGGLQRFVEVVVDDLESVGIGVVDADLLG